MTTSKVDPSLTPRRFVPPFGKLRKWRLVTVKPAEAPPLITLNRYPRQIIGVQFRLPNGWASSGVTPHYGLSVTWADPAQWWA